MGSNPARRPGAKARAAAAALAVTAAVALAASSSTSADLVGGLLSPCPDELSQPFLPWADPASYALAPDGGFESGGGGWTLGGGAVVVSGNEPFQVGGAGDAFSLSLPAGAQAQSPATCIGTLSPTVRLFARNAGSPDSTLRVDVVYRDALGLRWTATLAHLAAGGDWAPTAPVPVLANLTALPLLTGGAAQVSFRFTPEGAGDWQIDDLYVDPYKGT